MQEIKAIIFDWGGVLADAQTKEIFPYSLDVLEYCKNKGYRLTLASISSDFKERKTQIESSDLRPFFELVRISPISKAQIQDRSIDTKEKIYQEIMSYLNLEPAQVLIIDDRVVRGIKYGNNNGHPTVWVHSGRFSHELPDEDTKEPTYTITSTEELKNLI
ncbi:MAG: hypothetical protein COU06_02545 [Candidatus Harrisonbacteria bacterium CG10_big_fil_rev_8_21_14_0_10_38_8]|uniref:HAD family hydrolase n=1 Tax=Candidatus Harrisonbacteria bacterium CG10_big_fil_rev_8_21_14_0_10_38_8 TaxID=1974582 RepID=A0A2M6WJJ6_9BACT|nr:MAG: hypothetical protein COU06_02545 [Candidatus Harrisonbacteria bacterium CG10_big_fil_rev_8_21_14_0_10_38_8]